MGRDWRRIEAELDELIPAGPHSKQVPQSPGRSTDKDSILTHIAEALQLDLALSNRSALRLALERSFAWQIFAENANCGERYALSSHLVLV